MRLVDVEGHRYELREVNALNSLERWVAGADSQARTITPLGRDVLMDLNTGQEFEAELYWHEASDSRWCCCLSMV